METKKGTLSWLVDFSGKHLKEYVFSIIFAVISAIFSIAPYFVVARLITWLVNGEKDWNLYLSGILSLLGIWAAKEVFAAISTLLSHRATYAVLSEIRKRIAVKLTKQQLGDVFDIPSGEMKDIMIDKVDSIESMLAHVVPQILPNILISFGMVVYLFVVDWRMALASLITLPVGGLAFMGIMIGYEKNYNNFTQKNRVMNATAVEYINGIEVIKTFNQTSSSYEKFTRAAQDAADAAINWMKTCSSFMSVGMSVFPAVMVGVLPIGCYLGIIGTLELDVFIFVIILAVGFMLPFITVMSFTDDIAKIGTVIGEITEVLEKPELERPDESVEKLSKFDVTLKNINFAYKDKLVLEDVSTVFKEGEVTAIVGPSGSGKSTIGKLIASLWDVKDGAIYIGKTDIRKIPLKELNSTVAYVSQDNYLFDDTIRNNIRMGRLDATDKEVEVVAKKSGCHDFIMGLEKGYETIAGGAGGHLSGGERQRISIARAMLKNAPIIILDEATAYTDPESEAVIQRAISKLVEGKTLIVIAHRLSTISDSDKILVVSAGKIDGEGTHKALIKNNGLYRNLWAAHIQSKDNTLWR